MKFQTNIKKISKAIYATIVTNSKGSCKFEDIQNYNNCEFAYLKLLEIYF